MPTVQAKIVRYEDGLALVLDHPVGEQLDLSGGAILEVAVEGTTLIATPAKDEERRAAFIEAVEEMDQQYAEVFKRLAEQVIEPVFLEFTEVIELQNDRILKYGGSMGIRDLGLLEAALAIPKASFAGEFLHEDIYAMASAYLFHLVMNHAFIDGNKRIGLAAALLFLRYYGTNLIANEDDLTDLVLSVAEGKTEN